MVLIGVILLGTNTSLRLKKRWEFLEETVVFFASAALEIEYIKLPVLDILKKFRETGNCKNLDFISVCIDESENGLSFCDSWFKALELTTLPLRKEEKDKLRSFGLVFGKSDVYGQMSILSLYKEYFIVFADKARLEYEKYGKVCVNISVIIGLGIFIILM